MDEHRTDPIEEPDPAEVVPTDNSTGDPVPAAAVEELLDEGSTAEG